MIDCDRRNGWMPRAIRRCPITRAQIEVQDEHAISSGELTLHGITRPVVLTVTFLDCPPGGGCQFAAHGRIRRSEFGLPHGFWSGGDQVEIAISGRTH